MPALFFIGPNELGLRKIFTFFDFLAFPHFFGGSNCVPRRPYFSSAPTNWDLEKFSLFSIFSLSLISLAAPTAFHAGLIFHRPQRIGTWKISNFSVFIAISTAPTASTAANIFPSSQRVENSEKSQQLSEPTINCRFFNGSYCINCRQHFLHPNESRIQKNHNNCPNQR
jgi:hypothetical protein